MADSTVTVTIEESEEESAAPLEEPRTKPQTKPQKFTAELRKSLLAISEVENSLCVGETLLVQGKLRSHPYKVVLAGWVAGESVLISPSIATLAAGQIVRDEFLLVRYLFLGKVFGFETTARKILLDPPLVVLEWPSVVEVAAVSREVRKQAKLPVTVTYHDEGNVIGSGPAVMTELSQGGCRIKLVWQNEYMASYVPGSILEMNIPLGPNGSAIQMQCIVRNFTRQSNYALIGLQMGGGDVIKNQIDNILSMQLLP